MKKHDGWTLRVDWGDIKPYLVAGYFHETRSEVIKHIEKEHGSWKNLRSVRSDGTYKLVKVKMTEIDD